MEEMTAGNGQIRYLEEAGELYDFLLQLKAEKAQGIQIHRECI
jgi:hypothetical protein